MKVILIGLDTCSTCKRAEKFLKNKGVSYEKRSITEQHPDRAELKEWKQKTGMSWKKFFNTAGQLYRNQHLSGKLDTMLEDELLDILSSDGMWIKRPILQTDKGMYIGFNEVEWMSLLSET